MPSLDNLKQTIIEGIGFKDYAPNGFISTRLEISSGPSIPFTVDFLNILQTKLTRWEQLDLAFSLKEEVMKFIVKDIRYSLKITST